MDGLREGQGRLTTPDGFIYEGGWKAGEIDGTGVATYGNGDRYEGTFAAGKRQGQGVMRYATGQIASGEWQDNRLIEADQGSTDMAPTEDAPDLPAEAP